jgi:hypothetical protein
MLPRQPSVFALVVAVTMTAAGAGAEPPSNVTLPAGRVSSILGRAVLDGKGTEIGPIVDVLVDGHGRPRVAVIDVGGFLGIGVRRVAVAWETLRFERVDGAARITEDLTMDEVAAAPEYKGSDGPVDAIGPRP